MNGDDSDAEPKIPEQEELGYQSDASFVLELTKSGEGDDGSEAKGWFTIGRKKRKHASPKYSLKSKALKTPYDWHYNEWKHLNFMGGKAPISNEKLLELLQNINLTADKHVTDLDVLAPRYSENFNDLHSMVVELHAAMSSKHKYAKSLLAIVSSSLKAHADKNLKQ